MKLPSTRDAPCARPCSTSGRVGAARLPAVQPAGQGGSRGARATGVSRRALAAGVAAWHAPQTASSPRVRRPGGGRTRTVPSEQTLQDALAPWIDPLTRGAPAAPWRWTGTSGRQLAEALRRLGPATRQRSVATLLHALGSSLQANRQPLAGPPFMPRSRLP